MCFDWTENIGVVSGENPKIRATEMEIVIFYVVCYSFDRNDILFYELNKILYA
ncbi:hypothetical protein IMSAGC005_02625 [Lachnospiraceae bacterium]|nr:hypothetical protein IMSAGC005_02625 [Lachnospiraceae bacterium]